LFGSDELKHLISAADDCNVSFVYALSPGLDVVYSSASDISALKAKLDQVCKCCFCYFRPHCVQLVYQMRPVATDSSVVCVSVCYVCEPWKSGWTDRCAVLGWLWLAQGTMY